MKVCTDSCVFGATIPVDKKPASILDIGTGTGLLALMLAQRTDAAIDAVEMNYDAALQARDNCFKSQWQGRLTIHDLSIQDFFKITTKQYDLIVSNPPFFSASLRSGNESKDMAWHQSHLPVEELMQATAFMLKPEGDAYMLISIYEEENFIRAAEAVGLKASRFLSMYENDKKLIRYVLHFRKNPSYTDTNEIKFVIRNSENQYTEQFTEALKDFYLHL